MKLGKKQTAIFVLLGITVSLNYYMQNLILNAQTFSDGVLIGFVMGLLLVTSLANIFLFLNLVYINIKLSIKAKEVKNGRK